MQRPDFDDIPGTYLFTPEHSRAGYHLNMFCMTLNQVENRQAFADDEKAYLKQFPMTEEQSQAVMARDYLKMLQLGGNIYYTFKIAIADGQSMQFVGGQMSGVSEAEFKQMMLNGGRSIDGNRSRREQQMNRET